jgi:microcin C transport system substrate-binding protein
MATTSPLRLRAFHSFLLAGSVAGALVLAGCGGSAPPPPPAGATTTAPPPTAAWEPSKGCPPVEVPPGDFDLLGDPKACKGGKITLETNSFPTHLNFYGPERDSNLAYIYCQAMFMPLVAVHPITQTVYPQLASSWEETETGKTFVFHIDPDAVWSDGTPITSKDVLATYALIESPDVAEVVYKTQLDKFEKPVAVDDKTVRWSAKKASWRNLLIIADLYIYPAHSTDPKTYLTQWKFKPPVVSGPYDLGEFEEGKFITMVRRPGWWGEKKRPWIGIYNFDTVYQKVIGDNDIAFETMKKGDIDFFLISRAQVWVEGTEFDKVKHGWIQKERMAMRELQVPSEMAMNMDDALFKDVRVRKALFWLYDREYLHDQIFYHQYKNKDSYFANSIYENPDNEKVTFNPDKGLQLLADAGWTQKDADGVLMKDGQRFEFDFIYIHPSATRVFTPVQETFRKYGIKMNLKLIQPAAWTKISQAKDFKMIYANWGSSAFPEPREMWTSESADKKDTSNITHFRNAEVDALVDQYEAEYDIQKRAEIVRKIDGIVYAQCPYLLDWYSDNYRLLWWDKFGMPEWVTWPALDARFTTWATWWYDEARAKRLDEAMKAGTDVPRPPADSTYWKTK